MSARSLLNRINRIEGSETDAYHPLIKEIQLDDGTVKIKATLVKISKMTNQELIDVVKGDDKYIKILKMEANTPQEKDFLASIMRGSIKSKSQTKRLVDTLNNYFHEQFIKQGHKKRVTGSLEKCFT